MALRQIPHVSILLLLFPAPALAAGGAHLDADLDLGAPLGSNGSFAAGAGGRVGWRFDFGPVWLQPEGGGHYMSFFNVGALDMSPPVTSEHIERVFGGARLGGAGLISGVIEPALFGHAGYGWRSSTVSGPAFDVGFALDVKIARHFSFGVQGAYNVVSDHAVTLHQEGMSAGNLPAPVGGTIAADAWLSYGVHAGVSFDDAASLRVVRGLREEHGMQVSG